MAGRKKLVITPEIEIARLQRDAEVFSQVRQLLSQPLIQSIVALVALETLQRYQLIGQNVSTAMEVAIASGQVISSLVPAAQAVGSFIPGVKLGA